MLAMTTDFETDHGSPEQPLREIAGAGFRHLHWCHQWNTDFLYCTSELDQIETWLRDFGLAIHDLHGSDGQEKKWGSTREYERQAGIELVKNRLDMAARFSCPVVIMHAPSQPEAEAERPACWDRFRRTLDELLPYAAQRGVRIALENGDFDLFERVFPLYGPESLGLCYDSGHGNTAGDGLDRLDRVKDRLIALHLDDNDSTGDQHKPIFSGTVDWDRLASIIAASGYDRPCMTMEVVMGNTDIEDHAEFLRLARETGARFEEMVGSHRARPREGQA